MKYNKLIRDRIPEIIASKSQEAIVRVAGNEEYALQLNEKLKEEVEEYLQSESAEELADILEVVHALAKRDGLTLQQLEHLRRKKARERGGFRKRLILLEVKE